MRYFLTIAFCAVLLLARLPAAAGLEYYPDPVYQKLSDEDPLPMAGVIDLARQGDVRAQFIIGDLYAKGKGGMPQDLAEARRWFEMSATHGYYHGFIRLAALAKRDNKPAEAWQWYTLAIKLFDRGAAERKFAIGARDALMETAKISGDDLRQARKSVKAWENTRGKRLREEKEEALEQENNKTITAGAPEHEQN